MCASLVSAVSAIEDLYIHISDDYNSLPRRKSYNEK